MGLFDIKSKKKKISFFVIQSFFIFFAFILFLRLFELQIIDLRGLKEKAKTMRQVKNLSFRGEIFDRNGRRLATDSTLFDIYIHPRYYDKEQSNEQRATLLAPLLNMPKSTVLKELNKKKSTIKLAKNLDRGTVRKIRKLKIRGIDIVEKTERIYPQGNLASHILGYVNPEADIAAGVEKVAEKNLETFPVTHPVEKTGKGGIIYDFDTDPRAVTTPIKGRKLVLTIDSQIQHIAETSLDKMIKEKNAERGTVIVMNPRNGEILAFAVYPTYNPNDYGKVDMMVRKNWVLSDVYPPGSTFKIITVASAIESGYANKYTTVLDTGKMTIQGWTIKNYDYSKRPCPGNIGLPSLFEHSSNVGSIKIALLMPKDIFYNQLKLFGLGTKTGIDLPGESSGILPRTSTWDTVRQATIGFGYSIASTPIQMASAVSTIANGGIWVTPHVIKYDEETLATKIKRRRVLSPETSKTMTELLSTSIKNSKSTAGKIPNFTVAGKTGTSRKPNPKGGYLEGQVYTSFAGFFPSKNPQIMMMVVVDNPRGCEVWGSTVAGPIFNEIATEVTRILNLKPDAPGLYVKKKGQL